VATATVTIRRRRAAAALWPWLWPWLGLGLAGCGRSSAAAPEAARDAFAPPSHLTAALTADGDVALAWQTHARAPGGTWVEVATPGADFVPLGAVPADQPRFLHPQVAADTTFLYRLRPYFGPASPAATITTGTPPPGAPSLDEGPLDEAPAPLAEAAARSLRTAATAAAAAPPAPALRLASPTSVELRWEDRAADEEGYLVELAVDGGDFAVAALLPADATSFRKVSLPAATAVAFRVRPFVYGPRSKLVSVTSAPDDSAPR
jgi:hypothetical protein